MFDSLIIDSPKRKIRPQLRPKEFFPYYAGFPESFATTVIGSSRLNKDATIFDPWNGSGTTTTAAMKLGYQACGMDINPVMVMVARARNLSSDSVDLLEVEAKKLFNINKSEFAELSADDPLLCWFNESSATNIRVLEQKARKLLIAHDLADQDKALNRYSCLASNLYVALFNACRIFTKPFRSTNPTWLRLPKGSEPRLDISSADLLSAVLLQVSNIVEGLRHTSAFTTNVTQSSIFVGDSTEFVKKESADLILTSPPYCTRIDYTAATRVELALIYPLLNLRREDLSRQMIGSVRVPKVAVKPDATWGKTCNEFLNALQCHSSKASSGYYYKTHVDYFHKMSISIGALYENLKFGGGAVLVVQDSFYKDIHNDVPSIIAEMAQLQGLTLCRRDDFLQKNSLSVINSKSRKYGRPAGAIESVICFSKEI